MPRKNNKHQPKIIKFQMSAPQPNKKRYPNQRIAQEAADYLFLTRNIQLSVYKDIDGGWYLTKSNENH